MQTSLPHKLLLIASGAVAIALGLLILFATRFFYAGYGIDLGTSPSLLNEIRAPGLALVLVGTVIGLGAFRAGIARTSTVMAAGFYLAYGLSRWISVVLDGMPTSGLVFASLIELTLGALALFALGRGRLPAAQPA